MRVAYDYLNPTTWIHFCVISRDIGCGDVRTPYVFHSDKNENASKYHDMAFQFGSTDRLYMAIQKMAKQAVVAIPAWMMCMWE